MSAHLSRYGQRRCAHCRKIKRLSTKYYPLKTTKQRFACRAFGYVCKACVPSFYSRFHRFRFTQFRLRILKRRGFQCSCCKVRNKNPSFFDLDHIVRPGKRWRRVAPHNGLAVRASNLQVLCPNCHRKKTIMESIK